MNGVFFYGHWWQNVPRYTVGIQNKIAPADNLAAKPTRYKPAPNKPNHSKQKRQWR